MALTNTTLSAACGASDLILSITSTSSGFPAVGTVPSPAQVMRVGGEDMLIAKTIASGIVQVQMRGYNGTRAVPHDILSIVSTSATASDFLDVAVGGLAQTSPWEDDIVYLGEDTTFTAAGTLPTAGTTPYPIKNTTYIITKATACAITIIPIGATTPAASAASIGTVMTFINGTAQAHTVTYGPGFDGDTTTSDVATSNSKVGAALMVKFGHNGLLSALNASVNGSTAQWTLG